MPQITHQASRWIYSGIWGVLVRFFRVPNEPPDLPVRAGEYMASFQPAEGFLKYLGFLFWLFLGITDIPLTLLWVGGSIALIWNGLWWVAALIALPAIIIIVGPDILAYVAIHLRYDTTWYVMTDRSLRIRRGIWVIHETTITFENVQSVKVQQGPVQRYFGIANVVVETAGGGGGGGPHGKGGQGSSSHTGIIEGVSNAPEIRDRILARLRQSKTGGLGDDDHPPHPGERARGDQQQLAAGGWSAAHIAALREIRDALREGDE